MEVDAQTKEQTRKHTHMRTHTQIQNAPTSTSTLPSRIALTAGGDVPMELADLLAEAELHRAGGEAGPGTRFKEVLKNSFTPQFQQNITDKAPLDPVVDFLFVA